MTDLDLTNYPRLRSLAGHNGAHYHPDTNEACRVCAVDAELRALLSERDSRIALLELANRNANAIIAEQAEEMKRMDARYVALVENLPRCDGPHDRGDCDAPATWELFGGTEAPWKRCDAHKPETHWARSEELPYAHLLRGEDGK